MRGARPCSDPHKPAKQHTWGGQFILVRWLLAINEHAYRRHLQKEGCLFLDFFLGRFFLFFVSWFSAFIASLLFLLLCFSASLLCCSWISLLLCFSASVLSLLLCFSATVLRAFLPMLFYFFFSSVMCFCCSTSCSSASILPAFTVSLTLVFHFVLLYSLVFIS